MDADHSVDYGSPDNGSPLDVQQEPMPYFPNMSRIRVGEPSIPMVPIKKVTMHLQAGIMGLEMQQDFEDGGTLDVPLQWIEENEFVPHCLVAIKIRGDSMVPMLYQGDIAVVNIADTKRINGRVYAFNFNGEAVIKRLTYEGRDWYLTSDNPDHERRMCRTGECIIIGRVVRFEVRNFKDRL